MDLNVISRSFIALLCAMGLMFVFPSWLHAAPAKDTTVIAIENFHFAPTTLTVEAGTSVTWKNRDGEPHTVASVEGLFRSGGLDQNEEFSFKFERPGTYRFVCSIHPQMIGTIVVK